MDVCTHSGSGGEVAFGPILPTGSPLQWRRPTVTILTVAPPCSSRRDCEIHNRLWVVTSKVVEVQRSVQIATPPLSQDQLQPGFAGSWSWTSGLKLSITTGARDGNGPYLIDSGHSFALFASAKDLCVRVLAPFGSQIGTAQATPLTGLIYDARINVRVLGTPAGATAPIWAPLTQIFTLRASNPAVQTVVRIPLGARRVRLYNSLLGPSPPTSQWFIGDPTVLGAAAIEVGVVPWETGGQQRIQHELQVPTGASHLVFDGITTVDRRITLVWQIWA